MTWGSALSDEAAPVHPQPHSCRFALVAARSYFVGSMELDTRLEITLNGEPRRVPGGLTIAGMLEEIGLDPRKVAVERNRAIVPRSSLGEVCVEPGDTFEIVHFVGGG